jgi:hypothetical protein
MPKPVSLPLSQTFSLGAILVALRARAMTALNDKPASWRSFVTASIALIAFAAVLTWLAFTLLRPTPPRSVTMATDPEGSLNADLAKRYREFFARNGIDLKLVPVAGAVESLARLQDPRSGVGIAILPSGVTTQRESPQLVSMGTLFYEPLWFRDVLRARAIFRCFPNVKKPRVLLLGLPMIRL